MKRLLLIGLIILTTALVLFSGWLLTSQTGLYWVYGGIQSQLPVGLKINQLSGRLMGPITADSIEFKNNNQTLSAENIELDWNLWAIFKTELDIKRLRIESVNIRLGETDQNQQSIESASDLPQPDMPLALQLADVQIDRINIGSSTGKLNFKQIEIDTRVTNHLLQINHIRIAGQNFELELQGEIRQHANYAHDINTKWQVTAATGVKLGGSGLLSGDISSTRLSQQLQGALQAKIDLRINDLLGQPDWLAELDITSFDTTLFEKSLPALKGNIAMKAEGDLESATASGSLKAESIDYGPLSADFVLRSLEGENLYNGLNFDSLNIAILKGELSSKGRLNWAPTLSWQADATVSKIDPAALYPEWPGSLNAALSSQGSIDNDQLRATASISRLEGTLRDLPLNAEAELQWRENGLDISRLELRTGETQASFGGRIDQNMKLDWSLLSNNLDSLHSKAKGRLQASGQLSGPRQTPIVSANLSGFELAFEGYSASQLNSQLSFDFTQQQAPAMQLTAQDIILQGQPLQKLELTAGAETIRANITSELANAQLTLQGRLSNNEWRGQLIQADIQSVEFFDWQLQSPTDIELTGQTVTARNICLQSPDGAEFCSSLNGQEQVWKLDLATRQLPLLFGKRWLPVSLNLEGNADLNASLEYQSTQSLLGNATLELAPGSATYQSSSDQSEQFDYQSGKLTMLLEATGIQVQSALLLANGDRLNSTIRLPSASLLTLNPDTQILQASVRVDTKRLSMVEAFIEDIEALQGKLSADIEVSGTLAKPRFQGNASIRDGSLSIPKLDLSLQQINLDAQTDNTERVNYQLEARGLDGIIKLKGNTLLDSDQGWPSQLSFDAEQIQFAQILKPWLVEEVEIAGLVDSNGSLNFTAPAVLTGRIEILSPGGEFSYPLLEGEREQWDYRKGRLVVNLDAKGIKAEAGFEIGKNNSAIARINLPDAKLLALNFESQVLEGKADIDFEELELIGALVPEIESLEGKLSISLGIDGTLALPKLNARAEILDASMAIPRLGLKIDQIKFNGSNSSANQFDFNLSARSGDGSLAVEGSSQLSAAAGWPTTLKISGDSFEVSRIPEAIVKVSPNLVVRQQDRSIDIQGDLLVPYAKLQPKDITTASRVSEDTVIIGGEQEAQEKWLITSKINLQLGDRVSFFGFGFEGQLGGNLLIEDKPGQLTRGTGEINIPEGRYRAYGQRLDIEKGRMLFTGGPITNPGLDIRAIRTSNEVVAGIRVRGRLQQPKLELFSIPAMGQTDTLSYLLFGRPMESASGEEGETMAKAALALGLVGGDKLARRIGDRFGLDEMRVESSDSGDQASLVVGRYLSPRLYVSYGVGLIESVNSINLRYQISDKWQLKAESGITQGADFLYTIER